MIQGLPDFSNAMANLVASAAPLVTAIRVGPNRHITGIHWRSDTIVTVDQALPAQDGYSVILSSGTMMAARAAPRDPGLNLALLRLDAPVAAPGAVGAGELAVGSLVVLIGASFDGSPTARMGMVHGRSRANGETGPLLDIQAGESEAGGAVVDTAGRLLGMAVSQGTGQMALVPFAAIARHAEPGGASAAPVQAHATTPAPSNAPAQATPTNGSASGTTGRRGWLGVALQPITVPEPLVPRAGQTSGRMVVNITHGGPADQAGLRVGDVLLALNGYSTSGSHALRAFLGADRIGTQIEVRLLRDGSVLTTFLTVAAQ